LATGDWQQIASIVPAPLAGLTSFGHAVELKSSTQSLLGGHVFCWARRRGSPSCRGAQCYDPISPFPPTLDVSTRQKSSWNTNSTCPKHLWCGAYSTSRTHTRSHTHTHIHTRLHTHPPLLNPSTNFIF